MFSHEAGTVKHEMSYEPEIKPKASYPAVCAECKHECVVPFKPIEGRPVYCRECYSKRRSHHNGAFQGKESKLTWSHIE